MIGRLEGLDHCRIQVAMSPDFKEVLSKIQSRYGRLDLNEGMYVPVGKRPVAKCTKVRFEISRTKFAYKILSENRIQLALLVLPNKRNSFVFRPNNQYYMVIGDICGEKHTQAFMSDCRRLALKAENH